MSSDRVACRSLLWGPFKLPVLFQVALFAFRIVTDLVHKGSNHQPGFALHVSGLHHQQLLPLTPKSLRIFSAKQHRLMMIPCTTLYLQNLVTALKPGKHPDDFNLWGKKVCQNYCLYQWRCAPQACAEMFTVTHRIFKGGIANRSTLTIISANFYWFVALSLVSVIHDVGGVQPIPI